MACKSCISIQWDNFSFYWGVKNGIQFNSWFDYALCSDSNEQKTFTSNRW